MHPCLVPVCVWTGLMPRPHPQVYCEYIVYMVRCSCSIQAAMAPPRPQPPSPSPKSAVIRISESSISDTWPIVPMDTVTTFRVTFLSVTHHVCTYHAHTYVLCENRSSIQSLALMRSATRIGTLQVINTTAVMVYKTVPTCSNCRVVTVLTFILHVSCCCGWWDTSNEDMQCSECPENNYNSLCTLNVL